MIANSSLISNGMWPPQTTAADSVAHYNQIYSPGQRVGFTDAGIHSYYGKYTCVDIDGIVNAAALDAATRGQMFQYLYDHGIFDFVVGRSWWLRTWWMGQGTGFRYVQKDNGRCITLFTNQQIVANYYKPKISVADPSLEKWMGLGWSYPIPMGLRPDLDNAWGSASYSELPTEVFKANGVWSDGPESTIYLPLPAGHRFRLTIIANPTGFIPGGLGVHIFANGEPVDSRVLQAAVAAYPISLEISSRSGLLMTELTLKYDATFSPLKRGISDDARDIALDFFGLEIEPLD